MKKKIDCPCRIRLYKENLVRNIFEQTYGVTFKKERPTFLKNPHTNRNLELDGYNKELKLAFEYQGEFHYLSYKNKHPRSPRFAEQKIEKTKIRDNIKRKLCSDNGIFLVTIPYWVANILDYIKFIIENKLDYEAQMDATVNFQ